jgi:hypothetical protein
MTDTKDEVEAHFEKHWKPHLERKEKYPHLIVDRDKVNAAIIFSSILVFSIVCLIVIVAVFIPLAQRPVALANNCLLYTSPSPRD